MFEWIKRTMELMEFQGILAETLPKSDFVTDPVFRNTEPSLKLAWATQDCSKSYFFALELVFEWIKRLY